MREKQQELLKCRETIQKSQKGLHTYRYGDLFYYLLQAD